MIASRRAKLQLKVAVCHELYQHLTETLIEGLTDRRIGGTLRQLQFAPAENFVIARECFCGVTSEFRVRNVAIEINSPDLQCYLQV